MTTAALILALPIAVAAACRDARHSDATADMLSGRTTPPAASRSSGESSSDVAIANPAGDNRVLGTIQATFDGQQRTWYVLEGTVDGELQPGAYWYESGGRDARALIYGYDTPDVPFDTFRPEAPTGDYRGSAITLMIELALVEWPGSVQLPGDYGAIFYSPVVAEESLFSISDGRLEVTTLETPRRGTGKIEGTFSGTMTRSPELVEPFPVTQGHFEIEEFEYREVMP
jgi:hypothetical protein